MFGRPNGGMNTINRLREEMDQLFGTVLNQGLAPMLPGVVRGFPALNLWEDGQNFYAEAEVPGLTMEDIEVTVVGNELTLRGERKETERTSYHRRERGVGVFQRVVPLPAPIDADKVEAKLSHGVLTITLPKAEAARPRKIEVKSV